MYETQDSHVREEAQKVLISFAEDPEVLQKCQLLLQRASVSIILNIKVLKKLTIVYVFFIIKRYKIK